MNLLPIRTLLAACVVALGLLASASAQSLLNLKLGPGTKTGPAAIGIATNDFWNHYHPTNHDGSLFNDGVLVPLYSADGTNLAAGRLVYGVQTSGTNATGDATLDSWLGATGTNLTVILTNVPYGSYDIYLYGHGDADELNSLYQLIADWNDYGSLATTNTAEWSSDMWTEGAQFVVFRDVALARGQALLVQVSPNALGVALLNGLQLVSKEVPENQDTGGDGLSDWEEVHIYGTNPLLADTDGD